MTTTLADRSSPTFSRFEAIAIIQEKVAPNKDLIAEAFMGLESNVCDLKNMSIITGLAIDNSWKIDKTEDGSGAIHVRLSRGNSTAYNSR